MSTHDALLPATLLQGKAVVLCAPVGAAASAIGP
jgi:hypothetical protein